MKLSAIAKVKKKAESIVGILFLIVLCYGCGIRIDRTASTQKCNQAEGVVAQAEQKTDKSIQVLAKGKNEKTVKSNYQNLQTLQDAQEKAFDLCNPRQ
jgi:hypothetical protein